MKFGIGPYAPALGGEDGARAYHALIDQALRARDNAFDSVWVAERHFGERGECPAPFPLAAALATQVAAVRIGVLCQFGLTNPVYCAEDAATLDNLSGGRLILAAHLPRDEATWASYGVRPSERGARFWESVEIVQRAWAPQPFSFKGAHFRIPARLPENEFTYGQTRVSLTPKPAQLTIPLWVAPSDDEDVVRAARAGLPFLGLAHERLDELRRKLDLYRRYRGDMLPDAIVAIVRHVHTAISDQAARAAAGPALTKYYERNPHPAGQAARAAAVGAVDEWGVIGSVDTCIERLYRYRDDLGVNYVICQVDLPGLDASQVASAIDLFGKAVISEFRMVNFPKEIRTRFLEGRR